MSTKKTEEKKITYDENEAIKVIGQLDSVEDVYQKNVPKLAKYLYLIREGSYFRCLKNDKGDTLYKNFSEFCKGHLRFGSAKGYNYAALYTHFVIKLKCPVSMLSEPYNILMQLKASHDVPEVKTADGARKVTLNTKKGITEELGNLDPSNAGQYIKNLREAKDRMRDPDRAPSNSVPQTSEIRMMLKDSSNAWQFWKQLKAIEPDNSKLMEGMARAYARENNIELLTNEDRRNLERERKAKEKAEKDAAKKNTKPDTSKTSQKTGSKPTNKRKTAKPGKVKTVRPARKVQGKSQPRASA